MAEDVEGHNVLHNPQIRNEEYSILDNPEIRNKDYNALDNSQIRNEEYRVIDNSEIINKDYNALNNPQIRKEDYRVIDNPEIINKDYNALNNPQIRKEEYRVPEILNKDYNSQIRNEEYRLLNNTEIINKDYNAFDNTQIRIDITQIRNEEYRVLDKPEIRNEEYRVLDKPEIRNKDYNTLDNTQIKNEQHNALNNPWIRHQDHNAFEIPQISNSFPNLTSVTIELSDSDDDEDQHSETASYEVPIVSNESSLQFERSTHENDITLDSKRNIDTIIYEDPPLSDNHFNEEHGDDDSNANNDFKDIRIKQEPEDSHDEKTERHGSGIMLDNKSNLFAPETATHNVYSFVMLEDWGPKLQRSNCYCKDCEILFATRNCLDAHNMASHSYLAALSDDSEILDTSQTVKANVSVNKAKKSTAKNLIFSMSSTLSEPSTSRGEFCSHCNKMFPTKAAMITHLYENLSATNFPCGKCDRIFDKEPELIKHIENQHAEESDDDDASYDSEDSLYYQCDVCFSYFKRSFLRHMLKNHGKSTFSTKKVPFSRICKFCGLKFSSYKNKNMHIKLVHSQYNLKSGICISQKSSEVSKFNKVRNLKKVRSANNSDSKSPNFKCLKCGELFVDYITAYRHKKSKHPEILNKKIVTKIKKIAAPVLKKKITIKTVPETSIFVYNGVSNPPVPKSVLFKCSECPLHFINCTEAVIHAYRCVKDSDVWNCDVCCKSFKLNDKIIHERQHIISDRFVVHSTKDHLSVRTLCRCPKCEIYYSEQEFWDHLKQDCSQPKSVPCHNCNISIDISCMNIHNKLHLNQNFDSKDLILIEFVRFENENNDNQENLSIKNKRKISNYCDASESKKIKIETENHAVITVSNNKSNILYKLYKCEICQCCIQSTPQLHKCSEASKRVKCGKCDLYFKYVHFYRHKALHIKFPKLSKRTVITIPFKPESYKVLPKLYKCRCGLHFTSLQTAENHLTLCKPGYQISKDNCSKCGLLFPTSVLVSHLCNHHSNDRRTEFNIQHMTPKEGGQRLIKGVKSKLNPKATIHKCAQCDLCFLAKYTLRYHFIHNHKITIDVQRCTLCGVNFTKRSMTKHILLHHKLRQWSRADLNIKIYKKVANQIREQTASDDGVNYKTHTKPEIQKSHENVSLKDSNYYSKYLYQCRNCKLHFLRLGACTSHFNRYHEEGMNAKQERTNCRVCGLAFARLSLIRHMKIHHQKMKLNREDFIIIQSAEGNANNKLYKCDHCDVHFLTLNGYLKHCSKGTHSINKVTCDFCDYSFTKHTLHWHIYIHHESRKLSRNDFNIITAGFGSKRFDGSQVSQGPEINETTYDAPEGEGRKLNKSITDENKYHRNSEKHTSSAVKINKNRRKPKTKYNLSEKGKAALDMSRYDNTVYLCRCGVYFVTLVTFKYHLHKCNKQTSTCGSRVTCESCGFLFSPFSLSLHQYVQHNKFNLKLEDFRILTEKDLKQSYNTGLNNQDITADLHDSSSVSQMDLTEQEQTASNTVSDSESTKSSCEIVSLSKSGLRLSKRRRLSKNMDIYVTPESMSPAVKMNNNRRKPVTKYNLSKSGKAALDMSRYDNTVYLCSCGLNYLTLNTFKFHLQKCDRQSSTSDSKVTCKKCGFLFSPYSLCLHQYVQHEKLNLKLEDFRILTEKDLKQSYKTGLDNQDITADLHDTSSVSQMELTEQEQTASNTVSDSESTKSSCEIDSLSKSSLRLSKRHRLSKNMDIYVTPESMSSAVKMNNRRKPATKYNLSNSGKAALNMSRYDNTVYLCSCGLNYLTLNTFKFHLQKCDRQSSTSDSKVSCKKCGFLFSPYSLCLHQYVQHEKLNLKLEEFRIVTEKELKQSNTSFNHEVNSDLRDASSVTHTDSTEQEQTALITNENSNNTEQTKKTRKRVILKPHFNYSRSYLSSLNMDKFSNQLYRCKICHKHYITLSAAINHNHDLPGTKCSICGLLFTSHIMLKHKYIHHERLGLSRTDFSIQCNMKNSRKFDESEILTDKADKSEIGDVNELDNALDMSRYDNTVYLCSCGLNYLTFDTFKCHLQKCDRQSSTSDSKVTCKKCGFLFSPYSLPLHQYVQHEKLNLKLEEFRVITEKELKQSNTSFNHEVSSDLRDASSVTHTDSTEQEQTALITTEDSNNTEKIKKTRKRVISKPHFNYSRSYLSSLNMDKFSNQLYRCEICHKHYITLSAAINHNHDLPGTECSICGLLFTSRIILKHEYIHHERLGLSRTDFSIQCNMKNSTKFDESEILTDKADKSEIGDVNELETSSSRMEVSVENLDSNVSKPGTTGSSKSSSENNLIKLYKCGDCQVFYISQNTCYQHVLHHQPLDSLDYIECKVCGLPFPIPTLHKHMIKHHKSEFNLKDVLIEEYRTTENQTPSKHLYSAIDNVQSRLVSTTTDSKDVSEGIVDSTVNDTERHVDDQENNLINTRRFPRIEFED